VADPFAVAGLRIDRYAAGHAAALAPDLGRLLVDSVEHGASVGFLAPLTLEEATSWWRTALADPTAVTLTAVRGDVVVGCVRLHPAPQANGPHRAEVGKMLVHSTARRQGVAAALLAAAEDEARTLGRTTLVLDTETGSDAERLYARLGWERVGTIADYALDAQGRPTATTVFTKRLHPVTPPVTAPREA
jgi:GNAT superfamily N-acetyltransferase